MLIFLIGFMGCGKSTEGKATSELLNIPFLDLDTVLEQQSGQSISSFINSTGINAFRQRETEILLNTYKLLHLDPTEATKLNPQPQAVIATGGGCVLSEENRNFLQQTNHLVIWLDLPFELLISRITKSDRPLLQGLNEDEIFKLYSARQHIYETIATHKITRLPVPEQIYTLTLL
jgi:shikimate kinase